MTDQLSPILDAIRLQEIDRLQAIVDADPAVARGHADGGPSPLLFACYVRSPEAIEILRPLAEPLDVFEAAAVGDTERLRDLIATDPDAVGAVAGDGFHPLGLASFFGHLDAVALLVEHGADVNVPAHNDTKVGALHSAVAAHAPAIVAYLLEHGARVDTRQQAGITALMGAAHGGDTVMIAKLLEHGAAVDLTDDQGRSAADFAREAGADDVVDLLDQTGTRAEAAEVAE